MNIVNNDEKEASEVLHSLLSVDRRALDIKDEIIVEISNGTHVNPAAWQAAALAQHTVFDITDAQQQDYQQDQHVDQDIWQGHTIQIGTPDEITDSAELLQGIYHNPVNTDHDDNSEPELEVVERKPTIGKKIRKKKKIKNSKNVLNGHEKFGEDGELIEDDNRTIEDNIQQVAARLKKGCECQVSCYKGLNPESVYKHRLNIAELTKSEHDMYLMGVTMARIANPLETCRHKERVRLRASYVYQGRRVCLEAFLYLENVTHYQLKRIRRHVMTHGVAPRVHGNLGKKPHNTFSLDIYKRATGFMKHYLTQYVKSGDGSAPIVATKKCGSQNGRIAIYGDSRRGMYDAYKQYCEMLHPEAKLMGFSTFRHFVKDQFPHVKFCAKKPEAKESPAPFKSGKCMSYDKNKDPVRLQEEKNRLETKRAAVESKKRERRENEVVAVEPPQHVAQPPHPQQQQQHHRQQIQLQHPQHHHQQQHQHQQHQLQPQIIIQQQQQIHQHQAHPPPQSVQHQLVQQMSVQMGEDGRSLAQQMIPVAVVQQSQPAYIVTPVSHLQTATVQGAWYRRH